MRALTRWLGRKAILYVLLVLAVGFFTLAWPHIKPSFAGDTFSRDMMSPAQVKAELQFQREQAQERLEMSVKRQRAASDAEYARRLQAAQAALTEAINKRQENASFLDRVRPSKILERRQLDLRISALNLEIAALGKLKQERQSSRALQAARTEAERLSRVPTQAAIDRAKLLCRRAIIAVQEFDARWPPDQIIRDLIRGERARLVRTQNETCSKTSKLAKQRRDGLTAVAVARNAQERYADARRWTVGTIEDVSSGIPRTIVSTILKWAALLLAAIIALPLLIRLLFYFVLAPMAERRRSIQLPLARTASAPIAMPPRSQTSISVELREGEELLVRQGFLQSTAEAGSKKTRWLLDWRHPLSSAASGMMFLTRIAGNSAVTTVSAVHDPFAEVTMIELPRGSSCVLLPRSLAAVAQPIAQPLRVTSHWRLASLHAWLTLQLRYLVFHGPVRLVIKGARGVRVELAERGRIFGQRQLVGFSANLAYSVTRTETFWPYFFGHEQLFKDRVEDGEGILIIEEAPMAGQRHGDAKRGLEGAFDAGLKAFGL